MFRDDLSIDYVRDILDYLPATGEFRWRVSKGRRVRAGAVAGSIDDGYVVIRIDGKKYRAHRLAWLLTYGEWPSGLIDHRNQLPADNRISNLRVATESENQANSSARTNKTGLKGVRRDKHGSWRAKLCGKELGSYRSPEDAHNAYMKAAVERFGEFASA